ncbi:hypothetical protein ACIQ7Q_08065 [Streptomyces sp. NPDC096176]|uniref:hypothetical protein n=1 Tax=Streptomyces sp. NPDC096176 TaxID=3366079 RepID=UPI003826F584
MKGASEHFRFRFVVRGEKATRLSVLAVRSLKLCHPAVEVVVVDANDTPALRQEEFGNIPGVTVLHVVPSNDEVAQAVGRGARHHLFYWRHSPQLLDALPPTDRYDVHCDADILFLRPMDLGALLGPLSRGRIAAAVDESSIEYYGRLASTAAAPGTGLLPAAGSGGPLLQAGMIYSNPRDDGHFYGHFWRLAIQAAKSDMLTELPWDDMCVVSALLGEGGPCWERLLPLGHEWNYITDAVKDPGVFGCAAHYGGHRAKAMVLDDSVRLLPPGVSQEHLYPWGSTSDTADGARSLLRGTAALSKSSPAAPAASYGTLALPLCLTWLVPAESHGSQFILEPVAARENGAGVAASGEAAVHFYVDGHLSDRVSVGDAAVNVTLPHAGAETVSVIGLPAAGLGALLVQHSFLPQAAAGTVAAYTLEIGESSCH